MRFTPPARTLSPRCQNDIAEVPTDGASQLIQVIVVYHQHNVEENATYHYEPSHGSEGILSRSRVKICNLEVSKSRRRRWTSVSNWNHRSPRRFRPVFRATLRTRAAAASQAVPTKPFSSNRLMIIETSLLTDSERPLTHLATYSIDLVREKS